MKTAEEIVEEMVIKLMEKEPDPEEWDIDQAWENIATEYGFLNEENEATEFGRDVHDLLSDVRHDLKLAFWKEMEESGPCRFCDGTGLGRYEGTRCQHC